jgi:chloride channel protein, CIC family
MKSSLSLWRRFSLRRLTNSLENPRYLLKWLLMGTLIGVIAGIGAIVFYEAIHFASQIFMTDLVGYTPPDPAGEGKAIVMPFWSSARPWMLPLVTTLGGLISGIIVFTLAPEAEGHGTDNAIAAFHEGKAIRARIPLVKLVASAITIGTGGSAGREGPAAQISAGFGSLMATALHLDTQDRRIALATGMGAGIGAIFGAPLGGAILAAEILYKDDLEVEAIIPALIASIVGYSIFGAWSGWHPIFSTPVGLTFSSPLQLVYYVILGLFCGILGRLYSNGFYGIADVFHKVRLPKWLKPALGGLMVGLICLVIPQALGMGYGWIQVVMGQGLLAIPIWIIILLPFAKILTTGLTVGSGGSGGIFGPGMVIGGMVGALLWRISYHVLPGVPALPAPFVIIGMMALFGGVARAPLAVMLMVAEMTGNLSLLAPAMIAVSISYMIVGSSNTIYKSQLATRADSPAHRLEFAFPLLSMLTVKQAMTPALNYLTPQQSVAEAEAQLKQGDLYGLPVIDQQRHLLGILSLHTINTLGSDKQADKTVADIMMRDPLTIEDSETVDDALERLSSHRIHWMPVVETEPLAAKSTLVGIVSTKNILKLYKSNMIKSARQLPYDLPDNNNTELIHA